MEGILSKYENTDSILHQIHFQKLILTWYFTTIVGRQHVIFDTIFDTSESLIGQT